MRTFSLNSREFYEAVTDPGDRPWIPNGALPREPRIRDRPVIADRHLPSALAGEGDSSRTRSGMSGVRGRGVRAR